MSILDLEKFLSDAKNILKNFEAKVGWEEPDLEEEEKEVCSIEEKHWMPKKRLQNHVQSCHWRRCGYSKKEIKEIFEQEEITKKESPSSFVNVDPIIEEIAPGTTQIRSDERYKCSLNFDQRRAVYNACVAKLYNSQQKMPDQALYADLEAKAAEKLYQKENPENLSELEMLQKIRDMKKRRQSYRAKNVHITKRSQTEIIRGVLEVHMEELRNLWNPGLSTEKYGNRDEKRREERHDSHHREKSSYREDSTRKDRFHSHSRSESSSHHEITSGKREKSERKTKRRGSPESHSDYTRSSKRGRTSTDRRERSNKDHGKSSTSKKKRHKKREK